MSTFKKPLIASGEQAYGRLCGILDMMRKSQDCWNSLQGHHERCTCGWETDHLVQNPRRCAARLYPVSSALQHSIGGRHGFRHSELEFGALISGHRISNLRFAEEICLLAEIEPDLQSLVSSVNITSSRFGLQVSSAKTEVQKSQSSI